MPTDIVSLHNNVIIRFAAPGGQVSSKNMPALHASAIQLPGPGAGWVHWWSVEPWGRQTEANLSDSGRKNKKTKDRKVVW